MSKLNLILIGCLFFISCTTGKTYFGSELKNDLVASNVDLKKVQFYVDRDIVLQRQVSDRSAKVSGGEIKLQNGEYVHVVRLKKGTPGVITNVYRNKVDVAFEMGDKRYLTFGEVKVGRELPYTLFADSWHKGLGAIRYDGFTYYIMPGGGDAKLVVKKKYVNQSKVSERSMSGRKI